MYFVRPPSTQPDLNLAFEQYFLTCRKGDFCMLWRNLPTVVIGRNQNCYREIDFEALRKSGARLVRRISGGGAVYHDLGNVNFSFITDRREGDVIDMRRFCEPIIGFLATLGIQAELSGRNDIVTADGRKFSGNAQAVRNGRILHHGTLLFDTDLSALSKILTPDPAKLLSKGISSVRSRVVNLRELLPTPMTADAFFDALAAYLSAGCDGEYAVTDGDMAQIEELAQTYRGDGWTYGKNPACSAQNSTRFPCGCVTLSYNTDGGRITCAALSGDFEELRPVEELMSAMAGVLHEQGAIFDALSRAQVEKYLPDVSAQQLTELFFKSG